MKNFILGFLAAIVLMTAGLFIYLRIGAANVRADVEAPDWQNSLFQFAVRASVHHRAPGVQSEALLTDADLIAGGMIYEDACAGCHGHLDGPPRKHAGFLMPPRFAYTGTRYSQSQVIWIIKHGIRRTGMSAYGHSYTDEDLRTLAGFVRRMKDLPPPVLAALREKKG